MTLQLRPTNLTSRRTVWTKCQLGPPETVLLWTKCQLGPHDSFDAYDCLVDAVGIRELNFDAYNDLDKAFPTHSPLLAVNTNIG